ncbi:hypothetical protein [Salibacter halophilus]|uniref:Uncharacterized protein n=1 Tax=Salibacter halophilus TaxID=1803916 RepID=A0A6N6ME68_9FLAO|nr:hypothetical protein [Salibacter halophilus]KAB1066005.1 hypothetical protein F3059_00605 [Salibacter halophilus]
MDKYNSVVGVGYMGAFNLGSSNNMKIRLSNGFAFNYIFSGEKYIFNVYESLQFGSIDENGYQNELRESFSGTNLGNKTIYTLSDFDMSNSFVQSMTGADIGFKLVESQKTRLDILLGAKFYFFFPVFGESELTVTYEDGSSSRAKLHTLMNFNLTGEIYTGLRYVKFFNDVIGFSSCLRLGMNYSFWVHNPSITDTEQNQFSYDKTTGYKLFTNTSSQVMLSPGLGLVINISNI